MNFPVNFYRFLSGLTIAAALLFPAALQGVIFDCSEDIPFLEHRAEGNRLPYGDYVMIRSFREITQIIIRRDTYKTFVYTDRNNMLEGDITVSAFSEFDMTVSYPAVPSQDEFNSMLTGYLRYGYSANGMNVFSGLLPIIDRIRNGNYTLERFSDEYTIRFTDNGREQEIVIDPRWKKLVVRTLKGGPEAARCPSVDVDQTQDRNIRRAIYDFLSRIKKIRDE